MGRSVRKQNYLGIRALAAPSSVYPGAPRNKGRGQHPGSGTQHTVIPLFIKPHQGESSPLGCQTCHCPHLPLAKQLKSMQGMGRDGLSPWHGDPRQSPPARFRAGGKMFSPPNKGRSSTTVMLRATRIPRGSRTHFAHFPWTQRAGWGGFPGRSPRCRHGGGVSLTDHNTASSFLFLFSVLLAKQHNVYTSGYYICQNNYGMTNGTSM